MTALEQILISLKEIKDRAEVKTKGFEADTPKLVEALDIAIKELQAPIQFQEREITLEEIARILDSSNQKEES